MVSFSAGALFGDAFIHLLPEAFENSGFGLDISLYIMAGIGFSFIVEKIVHWRHCHVSDAKHVHPFAVMNLLGDSVHNFIDGVIIAAGYLASIPVGIATTTFSRLNSGSSDLNWIFCTALRHAFVSIEPSKTAGYVFKA